MLVGLIADTHDRLPAIAELVRQMQEAGVGMVLHAGDYCSPFALRAFEEAHVSLAGVFGRNDGDPQGLVTRAQSAFGAELFESPHSFEIGGRRILLVHDIGDVNKRSVASHEIVIHGSTHQQEMKTRGDTLIVNPGEACGWLYGTPSAALLELDSREVQFLSLSGPEWKY
ncbi:MAG TPA: metallophosphoesterase [Gemmatimonadaceae bacterium]|jgi:putative phosphoesterase|nr:metallophosphoesterase [Gemmatimonadaceae bacterium]